MMVSPHPSAAAARPRPPAPPRAVWADAAQRCYEDAKSSVRALRTSPALDEVARTAFGAAVTGRGLAGAIGQLDIEGWPALRSADLRQADAGYVCQSDTIYIARRLLEDDGGSALRTLLLHEIGHAIDARLGGPEAPGDEGAIFAALLTGETLGPAKLAALRSTDDHGILVTGGRAWPAEFAGTVYGRIKIDGSFSDWLPSDHLDTSTNAVTGYALFGTFAANAYLLGIQSTSASDLVIGAGTTIWLNTDQNRATGYTLPWGFTNVGAEYNVTFDSTGTPYLYTGSAGQTLVSPTPLDFARSPDGKSLEIAMPQTLLTPAGGIAPGAINLAAVIDGSVYLPGDYSTAVPEYTIKLPQPAQTYGSITVNGDFSDWTTALRIDTMSNAVAGYVIYGTVAASTYLVGIQATTATDQVIGAGTTIWLNTDQNRMTGYSLPWGFTNVGAEYNITFDSTGTPYLYTGGAGATLVSATPLSFALSADGKSLEIAVSKALVTPSGGATPYSISIAAVIDNAVYLPGDYSTKVAEYLIKDPTAPVRTYGSITVDGTLSEWTAAQRIDGVPGGAVSGYALYGTAALSTYLIGIQATASTDAAIGAGTTVWLNTDLNRATGYSLWGGINVGADYNVTFDSSSTPYLYTGAAGQTLVSPTPLNFALSADGKSLELAIPEGLLTPTAGGTAPTTIDVAMQIAAAGSPSMITYLPGDYTAAPQYQITDPATLPPKIGQHKVAIVYSDTTAARYFSQTAYSDLFMAAQNQARMAGIAYDVIDESQLTDVKNLVGYDALIFPSMANVNTAQLPAIMSALINAVYHYGISIIAAGDLLTNDQNGAALPGNAYVNMQALLNLHRVAGGNSGMVSITAGDVANPIMQGYTAGQVIQTYTNEGYSDYEGVTAPADVLVNQNISGVGSEPGVVETVTGSKNVLFSTADLLGDNNLLSHVLQSIMLGTQPGVEFNISRQAGIVAARMDMDQSQFPSDVSPTNADGTRTPGIYDKLVPILQQWKQLYNFVGSYFINIGDYPSAPEPQTTNWANSLAFYKAMEALGGEIGNHSYTHLLNPPVATVSVTTAAAIGAGTTVIPVSAIPNFAGISVGLIVSGLNIGANTPVPGKTPGGSTIANTQILAIDPIAKTVTIGYYPGGYGSADAGTLGAIPAGTPLTFSIPAENTNFLQQGTSTLTGSNGDPFTFDYQFNQSKSIEAANLGKPIYGAAIPGAAETYATAQAILPYYQSGTGYTGYVTGGWTGIGAGYPNAIGYMSPTSQGSVYIAPNIVFDFTEVQYQGKTVAQAEADWAAQIAALTANSAGTPIVVWPIHDYSASAWAPGSTSPYTTQMFTDFIAQAAAKNMEFVTLEQLAARVAAEQKAHINYTTVGNTVNVTVTPDPTAQDLGEMSLKVVQGGSNVIQNVANWYAFDTQQVFVAQNGGAFTVALGATQDNVTHIASLPSRADLLAVIGDGTNLNFTIAGDGQVAVDLKTLPGAIVSIQGAPTASLIGNVLTLSFADTLIGPVFTPLQHTVAIEEGTTEFLTSQNDIVIGTTGNDTLRSPGHGHNILIGNGGIDTLVFSGASTDYTTVANADGSKTVTDLRAGSPDGTDVLFGIAAIQFSAAVPATIASIVTSGAGISNGAGVVGAGSTITLTVNFSQVVTVAGTPTLTLNDGGSATYTGGSGSAALVFSNVVTAGQATPDLTVSSFNLPAGASVTSAGTAAVLSGATNYNPAGTLQVGTAGLPVAAPVFTNITQNNDGSNTLVGTGPASDTVAVYDGTAKIGSTTIGTGGSWTFLTSNALSDTVHVFTATAADAAGHVSTTSGSAQLGSSVANTLSSTSGNDVFIGNGGADIFLFTPNFGKDLITDFNQSGTAANVIDFRGNSFLNSYAAVVSHSTDVGANVVISQDVNNTLTVLNVNKSDLTAANFKFV